MRTFWGLLASALLLGAQLHACQAVFLCADGNVCSTCPSSPCEDEGLAALKQCLADDECKDVSAQGADCTKCCELTACPESSDKEFENVKPGSQTPIALHQPSIGLPQPLPFPTDQRLELLTASLPHGPPRVFDSRGPPTLPV